MSSYYVTGTIPGTVRTLKLDMEGPDTHGDDTEKSKINFRMKMESWHLNLGLNMETSHKYSQLLRIPTQ